MPSPFQEKGILLTYVYSVLLTTVKDFLILKKHVQEDNSI